MKMVSIIIPVYNSEKYLVRCLESVVSQRYDGEIEILLVDDGSTDHSGSICDSFASEHVGVRVFHISNRGASLARRYGLEQARGEFVTFVDSDDYVLPDYLSTLYSLIKEFNVGISACGICGSCGVQQDQAQEAFVLEGDRLFRRFFKFEFWGFWGKMYRRRSLLDITFPTATLSEDYNVLIRLFVKERRMAFTPKPLYCHERHEGSLSRQVGSPKAFEEFVNVKDVYDYVSSHISEYQDYALSNAVETSVKLLYSGKRGLSEGQRRELVVFLKKHRKDILGCKPLGRKVALLSLLLSI